MKIVAISDTHTKHQGLEIPKCDLLIHCGDWSFTGTEEETKDFGFWFSEQKATHKVLIPGNHEVGFRESYPIVKNGF